MEFEIGNVVKLISGGPDMTVLNIIGKTTNETESFTYESASWSDGEIVCQWFYDNKLESGIFKPETLEKVEKE